MLYLCEVGALALAVVGAVVVALAVVRGRGLEAQSGVRHATTAETNENEIQVAVKETGEGL